MTKKPKPSSEQLRRELNRINKESKHSRTFYSTIFILLVVAAIAVLVATLWLPVLQVVGSSMEPNMETGDIVLAVKNTEFEQGDIVAFYFNNKILLKRVMAKAGDEIVIEVDGTTSVNGEELVEPYIRDKGLGQCDLEFPYQVPDGRLFVMGDHRATSIDSRLSVMGCIPSEFIVGKVIVRIWPFNKIERF